MLFFCAVGMTMIIYSPYILSNAQIGLLALALFDVQLSPFKLRLHPKLKENWIGFWKTPIFWVPSLLFFLVLVGCFYSTDLKYSLERLQLKIPFLGLPFAFYCLPRLSKHAYFGLFYFLIGILFFTNIGIGLNYLLHFDAISEGIAMGQPIPTPRNHVRYSLLLSMGVLSGMVLCYKKFYFRWPYERWLILAFTLFNFIFIHILSVRSGLVILYSTMMIAIIALVLFQKKYMLGLGMVLVMSALPIIAYYTIPSFQSKVSYANWELQELLHGRQMSGSDQGRAQSIYVGIAVFKANPLLGVGPGDLKQAIYQKYDLLYPDQKRKIMPHNQFLSVAAGSGLIGLLIFIGAFLYPFIARRHFKSPFFLILLLTSSLSFLVENTLENSIGIGFYCLFLCMGLSYLTRRDLPDSTSL